MRTVIQSFYRAVETGDRKLLEATLAPDWEMIPTVYPGQPRGPEGYWPVVQAFHQAFPDAYFEIHEVLEAAPKFTVRTTLHGTHKGEFLGIAATGKRMQFDTIDIHQIDQERITRSWHIEDFYSLSKSLQEPR